MRLRDINLLAINEETNTKDKRIKAIHVPDSDLWSLRIQDTKLSDAGAYECQVTTDIETATQVHLKVLGKQNYYIGYVRLWLYYLVFGWIGFGWMLLAKVWLGI